MNSEYEWKEVPDWENMPSDDELLAARSVLIRLSRAISKPAHEEWVRMPCPESPYGSDIWGSLVEARRMLTVTMDWLSYWKPEYHDLWEKMLEQDE